MIDRYESLGEEERAARFSPAERIAMMEPQRRKAFLASMPKPMRQVLATWHGQARPGQRPPEGDWRIWLAMGGRGYGKTLAGAQWVHRLAEAPGLRIALVGPTEDEVRSVMIEGSSGILDCAPEGARPAWEPSLGRLVWPNGSQAFVYSGANPEALRGARA